MSTDKHRATAAAILPLVGGPDNIDSVTHCMTRLRIALRDRSLVRDEALRAVPGVLGTVEDDTYQIVLGPGTVARVTPEFERWWRRAARPHGPPPDPVPQPDPLPPTPTPPGRAPPSPPTNWRRRERR